MNTLRPANVRSYIEKRLGENISPATVNRELSLLSAALNYVNKELDWNLPNPAAGRRLREPEGRVRWLTQDEYGNLLSEAARDPRADHLPDFIRLATNTSCRVGELLGLEWKRVDL